MRGMATFPQGNQELLVVRDKSWKTPGELGASKSMECDIFPFSALTLLIAGPYPGLSKRGGRQVERHLPSRPLPSRPLLSRPLSSS